MSDDYEVRAQTSPLYLPGSIVLVLGAGVSQPYGFPSGPGLVREILQMDVTRFVNELGKHEFTAEEIMRFQSHLREASWTSIDRFLEGRPELSELGRLIAFTLMGQERQAVIGDSPAEGIYHYLWNNILDPRTPDDFGKLKTVVITYNYDRSLEFFLYRALMRAFNLDNARSIELMRRIPIIHVHGSLGSIDALDSPNYRPYEPSHRGVRKAASRLKIVSEQVEKSVEIAVCRMNIAEAEMVVFLGFRFDQLNVTRLEIPAGKAIRGTRYGFTNAEYNARVVPLFADRDLHLELQLALDFLRDSGHAIWAKAQPRA